MLERNFLRARTAIQRRLPRRIHWIDIRGRDEQGLRPGTFERIWARSPGSSSYRPRKHRRNDDDPCVNWRSRILAMCGVLPSRPRASLAPWARSLCDQLRHKPGSHGLERHSRFDAVWSDDLHERRPAKLSGQDGEMALDRSCGHMASKGQTAAAQLSLVADHQLGDAPVACTR